MEGEFSTKLVPVGSFVRNRFVARFHYKAWNNVGGSFYSIHTRFPPKPSSKMVWTDSRSGKLITLCFEKIFSGFESCILGEVPSFSIGWNHCLPTSVWYIGIMWPRGTVWPFLMQGQSVGKSKGLQAFQRPQSTNGSGRCMAQQLGPLGLLGHGRQLSPLQREDNQRADDQVNHCAYSYSREVGGEERGKGVAAALHTHHHGLCSAAGAANNMLCNCCRCC